MWPSLLVHLHDTRGSKARAGRRAAFLKVSQPMPSLELDDDDEDDLEEDEDFDEDDEDSDDEDDEEGDDDVETWQVSGRCRLSSGPQ
jgi:hypothetical protein